MCNSIWMIDDFSASNGATRIVPGTHRMSGSSRDYMNNPVEPHLDEVLLVAPAGTVAIFGRLKQ